MLKFYLVQVVVCSVPVVYITCVCFRVLFGSRFVLFYVCLYYSIFIYHRLCCFCLVVDSVYFLIPILYITFCCVCLFCVLFCVMSLLLFCLVYHLFIWLFLFGSRFVLII